MKLLIKNMIFAVAFLCLYSASTAVMCAETSLYQDMQTLGMSKEHMKQFEKNADVDLVKEYYRKLSLVHHPDIAGGCAETFKSINTANYNLKKYAAFVHGTNMQNPYSTYTRMSTGYGSSSYHNTSSGAYNSSRFHKAGIPIHILNKIRLFKGMMSITIPAAIWYKVYDRYGTLAYHEYLEEVFQHLPPLTRLAGENKPRAGVLGSLIIDIAGTTVSSVCYSAGLLRFKGYLSSLACVYGVSSLYLLDAKTKVVKDSVLLELKEKYFIQDQSLRQVKAAGKVAGAAFLGLVAYKLYKKYRNKSVEPAVAVH